MWHGSIHFPTSSQSDGTVAGMTHENVQACERASRDPYDYRARDRNEGGNTSESTESIQNVNNMAVGEIGESGARSSFYTQPPSPNRLQRESLALPSRRTPTGRERAAPTSEILVWHSRHIAEAWRKPSPSRWRRRKADTPVVYRLPRRISRRY